jgi:flagellar protein FlgJ
MTTHVSDISDFGSLQTLRTAAANRDPTATAKTATQFESLFAEQLVKSMRQASFGDPLFPGESKTYRDMYDHELAKQLTHGKGLGLAPMIQRALGQSPAPTVALGATLKTAHAMSLARYARTMPVKIPLPVQTPTTATQPPASNVEIPSPTAAHALPQLSMLESSGSPARPGIKLPPEGNAISRKVVSHRSPDGPSSHEAFIATVWPHAQRAAAALGVDPKALVAQAALETGWGKSVGGAHNLFGIKATQNWHGASVQLPTSEFVDGSLQKQTASFRSYASVGDSFDDYVHLLKSNPRYANAVGTTDTVSFARAMQKAGYATDPAYANKIASIANSPAFAQVLQNSADGPLIASR